MNYSPFSFSIVGSGCGFDGWRDVSFGVLSEIVTVMVMVTVSLGGHSLI